MSGRLLAGPDDGVRGPAGAAARPRDPGGEGQPALSLPHGVGQAAAGGQTREYIFVCATIENTIAR